MILNHRLQHAEANSPEVLPAHTTDEPQPRGAKVHGDHRSTTTRRRSG